MLAETKIPVERRRQIRQIRQIDRSVNLQERIRMLQVSFPPGTCDPDIYDREAAIATTDGIIKTLLDRRLILMRELSR